MSGGEAQRIKLAQQLAKPSNGHTLFILDEPTTGLHIADVQRLIDVLQKLVDQGNTVAVIEHNMEIIREADFIIDLGPEGGYQGGRKVFSGSPPELLKATKKSHTAKWFKKYRNQKMSKKYELKAADLRCVCDHRIFKFKNTSEIKPLDEVIGQKRAVQAIEFGLNMKSAGYNIFVTGVEGTGKSTIVRELVSQHANALPRPDDWCLVNNFKDEFRPKAIAVPPGKAVQFRKKMNKFVEALQKDLPKAFEGESYLKHLSGIKSRFSDKQNRLFRKIDKFAAKSNLQIIKSEQEIETVPVIDGTPLTPEDYNKLPNDKKAAIEANVRRVQEQIEMASVEVDKLNQALHTDVEKLMDKVTFSVVSPRRKITQMEKAFSNCRRNPTCNAIG
jgi:ABC-type Mn2+/Zn2+ transport system ATPase subunit